MTPDKTLEEMMKEVHTEAVKQIKDPAELHRHSCILKRKNLPKLVIRQKCMESVSLAENYTLELDGKLLGFVQRFSHNLNVKGPATITITMIADVTLIKENESV